MPKNVNKADDVEFLALTPQRLNSWDKVGWALPTLQNYGNSTAGSF
ncbi:hypothetical protein ACE1CB_10555 [Aerosakkonema sp. BLCC-F2]